MSLKRKTPDTINADLTIKCQGETVTMAVTFNNLAPADYDAHIERISGEVGETFKDDKNAAGKVIAEMNARIAQLLVNSWESEYETTVEDFKAADRDRPGLLHGLIRAYHQSREANVAKN